jgi:dihydrofolate reductase
MRKVTYAMFASLDGYIEDRNGTLDWSIPDEELHQYVNDLERDVDTYLYGRRLYEIMAGYWPTAESDPDATDYTIEYARIWNPMAKVVFSRSLQHVEHNARLVREDIAAEVSRLKSLPGKDLTLGGASLAESFFRLGLVDEVQVYIHPVILGGGKPMFRNRDDALHLRLLDVRSFSSGVVHVKYSVVQQ